MSTQPSLFPSVPSPARGVELDVEAGAAPGGGTWTWDATTGLLVHRYADL